MRVIFPPSSWFEIGIQLTPFSVRASSPLAFVLWVKTVTFFFICSALSVCSLTNAIDLFVAVLFPIFLPYGVV